MKIHEFLTEKTWCKRNYAEDIMGHDVDPTDSNAVCWSLVGAMALCCQTWEERVDVACKLTNVLGNRRFTTFNDNTTWAELYDVLVKADV